MTIESGLQWATHVLECHHSGWSNEGPTTAVFCPDQGWALTLHKGKMEMNEKRESTCLRSEGGHKVSVVELIIVQLICNRLGIGNAIPTQLVLSLCHGKQGKHKHERVHQNLWGILTRQLAAYPLRQV